MRDEYDIRGGERGRYVGLSAMELLSKLLTEHEAWQVDWGKLTPFSADHDPEYKPTYSPLTAQVRQFMDAAEQGQPQQEPATDEGWGPISRYSDLVEHMRRIAAYGMDVPESGRHLVDELLHEHGLQRVVGSQERQAGGHVHERGYSIGPSDYLTCKGRDVMDENNQCINPPHWVWEWERYEQGVADAAAQAKER